MDVDANCAINPCLTNRANCVPLKNTPITSLSVALPVITIFFILMAAAGVGVAFIRRIPDSKLMGTLIVLAAACMWIFWLVAFLAQLNPLEAPVMDTLVAGHIRKVWASSETPDSNLCQVW